MNIRTLKVSLVQHSEKNVRFVLPDGDPIPQEFHVTEVGHVVKKFINCGGTARNTEACLLQTWVSDDDKNHRLTAGKLAKIPDLSRQVVPSDELNVEVEYDDRAVGQYTVESVATDGAVLSFQLGNKKTDCFAREACGLEAAGCGCGPADGSNQCC
jgi:Family of unknown function (DUF6428)